MMLDASHSALGSQESNISMVGFVSDSRCGGGDDSRSEGGKKRSEDGERRNSWI